MEPPRALMRIKAGSGVAPVPLCLLVSVPPPGLAAAPTVLPQAA